jgi:hypothetical protein
MSCGILDQLFCALFGGSGRVDWSKEDEFQTGLLNRSAEATLPIFEICVRSLSPADLLRTTFVTSVFQHFSKLLQFFLPTCYTIY